MALPRTVHVVRAGTAGAALDSYLRGHEDAVSWTPDIEMAIAFLTADAAKRYAARRLGGAWHVAEVDRSAFRRVMVDEEFDTMPERDADIDAVLVRVEQDDARAPRRAAIRHRGSSPWAA